MKNNIDLSTTEDKVSLSDFETLTLTDHEKEVLFHSVGKGTIKIKESIPSRVREAIKKLGAPEGLVALLIKDVPIDVFIPATPENAEDCNNKSMPIADAIVTAFSLQAGSLQDFVGKIDVYKDNHVHNLYPIKGNELTQLGSNRCTLDWHVEDGFLQEHPNICALLCVRGSPEAKTQVSFARHLQLEPEMESVLRQARFVIDYDETFEIKGKPLIAPIISGPKNDPLIRVDFPVTHGLDEQASDSLLALREAIDEAAQSIILEKGDLLFFDNHKIVHARNAYNAVYDGTGRWLKRVLVSKRRP